MEIKNNFNIISISKTEKNDNSKPISTQTVQEKDYLNSPNPTEYIGRSQVVFRGKTQSAKNNLPQINKDDLQPIKLIENPILSKEECIKTLNEMGYKPEEIDSLNLEDEKVLREITGLKSYLELDAVQEQKEELLNELRNYTPEKRMEFINEEIPEYITYLNQTNYETLNKYFDLDIDDFFTVCENISESENKEELLKNIPLAYLTQGKIEPRYIYTLDRISSQDNINYERANILRQLNEVLPENESLPIAQCNNLGDTEDLTPDNVEKYFKLLEKFGKNENFKLSSFTPVYQNKSLKELTETMSQIDSTLEKFPMDFSTTSNNDKLDVITLEKITQRQDIAEVQKYINSLTPEAKTQGILRLPEENSNLGKDKIVEICNIISEPEYGVVNNERLFEYINQQEENNYENLDGIIKLIQRYKNSGLLNTIYMDRALTVGGNDYDAAVTSFDLKDEIDKKELNLSGYKFFDVLHNPDSDLKEFNRILSYINENNINCYHFHNDLLSDKKGYNKLVLNNALKNNGYYNQQSHIDALAEMLNNDEEIHFAIDLLKQPLSPDEDEYRLRFGGKIDDIKEIMQEYQNDKETTQLVIEMKNDAGDWRVRDKNGILALIESYHFDKEMTDNILNLRKPSGHYRFVNGVAIKSIVEASQMDKEYTLELLDMKNTGRNAERYPYRFDDAAQISDIVQAGQIDKDYTNYLINTNRISDTKDYLFFASLDKSRRPFIENLMNATEDNYKGKTNRFSIDTIKTILKNPPENEELFTKLINERNQYDYFKYSGYEILQLAKACLIDKDLTEKLLNETFTSNKHEYNRFTDTHEILNILNSYKENKDLTNYLLKNTLFNYNKETIPRFNGQEIKNLVDLSKENDIQDIINLVNMKVPGFSEGVINERFNSGEIRVVLQALKIDRDFTEELLNKTSLWKSDNVERPYYSAENIQDLINASQVDKDLTIKLINDEQTLRNPNDIYYIVNAAKEDKDTAIALHKLTVINKGEIENRFNGYEIGSMMEQAKKLASIDKNFVLDISKLTITNNGVKSPRFNTNGINDLITSAIKDYEFTKFLINKTKTDENGNKIPSFNANEIYSLVENITFEEFKELETLIGKNIDNYTFRDIQTAIDFPEFYNVDSINEIPIEKKKSFLNKVISCNASMFETSQYIKKDFPLIPTNVDEYCSLLPSLVHSIGIETNELKDTQIQTFNKNITSLSDTLSNLSDEEFNNLDIKQEFSKDEFILVVLDKLKQANLPQTEQQKVFDYYGFELHKNPNNSATGYSIVGYPVNLNNGKKLAQIEREETRKVVEDLRKDVIKFSENNKIHSNNNDVEKLLNEIIEILPELRTTIDKKQHGTHDFDILKHSLKVMQKITQNPDFKNLNENDKKIMLIASLMHDITKAESVTDKTHPHESAFDTYYITKKFKLSQEEEIKLHRIISSHEWLGFVNAKDISENERENRMKSIAFDLQQGNLFDMATIFTKADLKAIKKGDDPLTTGWANSITTYAPKIKEYIEDLKKSQPLLPTTKMPKSSEIEKSIKYIENDGSTNLRGVYKTPEGLIVIKFNEVDDWEALGLPEGSTNKGIKAKAIENINREQVENETETGNIKFFVHGLDYANQLAKFEAFAIPNSDALLSVSYAERPETKYRFFRPQGVLLDVPADYVYGGGNTDSGSGCGKDINNFKQNYVFGGYRESDRKYISELIKEETGLNDEEYVEFIEQNKDKPFTEIQPKELQEKIIKKFATINSNHRTGNRAYNEMYISNPKEVMGVFAYEMNDGQSIDNPLEFLKENSHRTEFLKKYALEHNIPFYVFGE